MISREEVQNLSNKSFHYQRYNDPTMIESKEIRYLKRELKLDALSSIVNKTFKAEITKARKFRDSQKKRSLPFSFIYRSRNEILQAI